MAIHTIETIRAAAAFRASDSIREWIFQELLAMARHTGVKWNGVVFHSLYRGLAAHLEKIGALARSGRIRPWLRLRTAETDRDTPPERGEVRVGVFPIAGNPIHWGHLSCGLRAVTDLHLDKVVFVIAGTDARKPDLIPEEIRHGIAGDFLPSFAPFFSYSPIALGSSQDGETAFFRILSLNSGQKLNAFYLAGSDHYNRFDPRTGSMDTIAKLERNISDRLYGYDERMHRVTAAFFRREAKWPSLKSSLSLKRLPGPTITVSSTLIRECLEANRTSTVLFGLPHTVFLRVARSGIYASDIERPLPRALYSN